MGLCLRMAPFSNSASEASIEQGGSSRMQSDATAELDRVGRHALAMASAVVLSLGFATGGSAHAQTSDSSTAGSINLGARGNIAAEPPARLAPAQAGATSPFELSARGGFATDYIYRGTTLSDHRPAAGAAFEATAFGFFYAAGTIESVKLPSQPAAEITMVGGVRPMLGNVTFDFGWT